MTMHLTSKHCHGWWQVGAIPHPTPAIFQFHQGASNMYDKLCNPWWCLVPQNIYLICSHKQVGQIFHCWPQIFQFSLMKSQIFGFSSTETQNILSMFLCILHLFGTLSPFSELWVAGSPHSLPHPRQANTGTTPEQCSATVLCFKITLAALIIIGRHSFQQLNRIKDSKMLAPESDYIICKFMLLDRFG